MKPSKLASVGLIALAYGSIFAMTAADGPRDRVTPQARAAARQANEGAKALNRHDVPAAVTAAEQAVAMAPREAAYRLLLGQSYLQAGRFASAGQAFGDTLALDPSSGKAALNLALTQVATGDWQAARRTLAAHSDTIPGGDRGLAMALAGDTEGAVALLTEIVRSPDATPKARQNLALAYALAGQWQAARVVAAVDMSPADVDARMLEWAAFAQPRAASDQVASLIGVQPVADGGQPVALALNAPVAAPVQVAEVPVQAAPAPVVETQVVAVQAAPAAIAAQRVAFGPRHEVVQQLPVTTIAGGTGPMKVRVQAAVAARTPAGGSWFVQLGAFDNAGVARDAWGRARRRFAGFAAHTPQGMNFHRGTATFYRLSVGGFARADADRACRAYRATGGDCFVRAGAGDQVASWARPGGVQMAAR